MIRRLIILLLIVGLSSCTKLAIFSMESSMKQMVKQIEKECKEECKSDEEYTIYYNVTGCSNWV